MRMTSSNYLQDFINLYPTVFDEQGNIKDCDRENCKKLIWLASHLTEMGTDYGNVDTGQLEISNIKKLYTDIIKGR